MPTYEYRCTECGSAFDVSMSIEEKKRRESAHDIACEQCGSSALEQVFGGFSVLTGAAVGASQADGSCCGGSAGGCCG